MTVNDFIAKAELELGKVFPELVIRLFPDPDDDSTFFAYMFCVPDGREQDVKSRARDFIRRHLSGEADWTIIPAVKNLSVTKEHYPQYLKTAPMASVVSNADILRLISYVSVGCLSKPCSRETHAESDYTGGLLGVIQPPPQGNHESEFRLAA